MSSKVESTGGGTFSPALQDPVTPDSSDFSNDELKEPATGLYVGTEYLSSQDIIRLNKMLASTPTFTALKSSFATILIIGLVSAIMKSKMVNHESWMHKLLVHVLLYHTESMDQALAMVRGFSFDHSRLLSTISWLRQHSWNSHDIETFLGLCYTDLTRSTIESQLVKPMDEIQLAFLHYPVPWTQQESRLLHEYADDLDHVVHNLPCRSSSDIQTQIDEYVQPKSHINDKKLQKYLNLAICHDLTRNALTAIFPEYELSEVVAMARDSPEFKENELTSGEKVRMKELVKINATLDEIALQLPCRQTLFLVEKRKDYSCIGSRKTNFKSATEQLIYEAQWHMLTSGTSRGSRRARRDQPDLQELQQQATNVKKPKIKTEETAEKIQARLRNIELKRQQKEEKKRQMLEKRRLNKEIRQAQGYVPKPRSNKSLNDLLLGSTHFQSVMGDKKAVEVGQKRRRVKPGIYDEATELKTRPRQARKNEIKKMIKIQNQKPQKRERRSEEKIEKYTPERETPEQETPEQEDFVSPFDPTDINTDTLVPLHNRQLFVSEFYQQEPKCPDLNFCIGDSFEIMTAMDSKISYDEDLAYHIVKSHTKNYRSLPISFPSLMDNEKLNPINKVRLRFLLYPQHTELFVLGQPKSNELDPVYEIIKLMMIHWALYFSHSPVLKDLITSKYCKKLELSVEENDFGDFINIVDRWNLLMLELSPNTSAVEDIRKSGNIHLNGEIKKYLGPHETVLPLLKDLDLELFYLQTILENVSPSYQLISGVKQHSEFGIEVPDLLSTEMKALKPDNYNPAFFLRLQEKSDVSRFAIQQILLRVYSRVVSTDSRKLRSYKAFTAEVYGELLPSFTSEVLEKVKLMPNQKFYDLGSGVGNTTFQAALEFGAAVSGGCELMEHASKLTELQQGLMTKHLALFGLKELNLDFALLQSFVDNEKVRQSVLNCDVLIINNYLFDVNLNTSVGRLLYGLRPGTKIISLRNFIRPRYKACGDTVFDRLRVEKHEMSDFLSVSWTANKVPYYISTVEEKVLGEYLSEE